MSSILEPILGSLEPWAIYVFIAMMAVCLILSVIKKVFKITALVSVLIIIAIIILPMANDFQDRYGFSVEDGVANIKMQGQVYKLDSKLTKSIEMKDNGSGDYLLIAPSVDNEGTLNVLVAKWMLDPIKEFADRYGIKFTLID